MAQPKQTPLAVRCRPELRARIEAYAKTHNLTRNGAAVLLWERGLDAPDVAPPADRKAAARAAHQKAQAIPSGVKLDTSMVPFNPNRAPLQRGPDGKRKWNV